MLSDERNDLYYGSGRVAQVNGTNLQYFLGDALPRFMEELSLKRGASRGSVRQLTNATGDVTLAKAYDPYGNTILSVGDGQTEYGYTGEYTDPTGLVYLRARYYQPEMGRFLSKDLWQGNTQTPMSFNEWLYGYSNPIRYIDPAGKYNRDAAVRFAMAHDRDKKFPDDGYYNFPTYPDDQCTMFVSSALSVGGYPTSSDWPGYEGTRIDSANPKYDYEHFFSNRKYGNGQDYEHAWIKTEDLFTHLRKSNALLEAPTHNGAVNFASQEWSNWIQQNYTKIMPGDVVFYKSVGSSYEWSHAAMVVGWGSRTHFISDHFVTENRSFYSSYECVQQWGRLDPLIHQWLDPLVVERSGSIKYALARSIGNTASGIEKMSIIQIR